MKITEIEKTIIEKKGNIAAVARSFSVSRKTIYNKINQSERLKEALENARETMLDNAERALYDEALDGNTTALIFFLKTQGKSRGYTERQEIAGVGDAPLTIEHRVIDYRGSVAKAQE